MKREPGIFYLADEHFLGLDGKINVTPNVLHFKFPKTGFDGRADRDHVKNFEIDFSQFMEANPEYKLPWAEEPSHQYVNGQLLKPGEVFSVPVSDKKEETESVVEEIATTEEVVEELEDEAENVSDKLESE